MFFYRISQNLINNIKWYCAAFLIWKNTICQVTVDHLGFMGFKVDITSVLVFEKNDAQNVYTEDNPKIIFVKCTVSSNVTE